MRELAKRYDPSLFEERIYQMWESHDLFRPEVNPDGKPYTIMMPPPNVTGKLHIGHAYYTFQDLYIRMHRMMGDRALWQPGTDHASISTEARVVAKIRAEGHTKEEIGREAFLEEAWHWTHTHGDLIERQLRKLGASCDWSRSRFTLDAHMSDAVLEAFIRLYDRGMIYRGDRIINWCPECRTAISDAEVEHVDTDSKIWEIAYPREDGEGHLVVATTRPETMLGDLAVAVHPDDVRYRDWIGSSVRLPLTDRVIPIIADAYVDSTFGTGVVKITPSHDPNDFAVGERHGLGQMVVIGEDAKMTEAAGAYAGMDRYAARAKILEDLKAQGLLVSEKAHANAVGHCERCHTVIEPLLSKQWFVRMEELSGLALDALDRGEPKFYPERFEKTYRQWLENLRDWCISRQLWWGHRIPAYYCLDCGHVHISKTPVDVCAQCGSKRLEQDPDTMDTWFSSALWPFATLGWPDEESPDFQTYFPTDLLVTGYDIIFFWVIRMVFSSLVHTGKVPFRDVLLTGLIRDAQGRKMSKSLDNGIDPIDCIEKYGADALRYVLMTGTSPGNDICFQMSKLENGRNFANKVWNASRFALMHLPEEVPMWRREDLQPKDVWILHELNETIQQVQRNLSKYEVSLALEKLYNFIWGDYCDDYIEFSKKDLYGEDGLQKDTTRSVLLFVLDHALRLLHPFMPFITEEIYQSLPSCDGYIMTQKWPEPFDLVDAREDVQSMRLVQEMIRTIRNARSVRNIELTRKSALYLSGDEKMLQSILPLSPILSNAAMLTHVQRVDAGVDTSSMLKLSVPGVDMYLPLSELIDVEAERQRLQKEVDHYAEQIRRLEAKLENQGFVDKAPAEVVEKERAKLADFRMLLRSAEDSLKEFTRL